MIVNSNHYNKQNRITRGLPVLLFFAVKSVGSEWWEALVDIFQSQ